MSSMSEIAKWREAHPTIELSDEALKTAAPFPSLRLTEFLHYVEATKEADVARFVRDLRREIWWTYDNWKKALRDSSVKDFMLDLINSAKGTGGPDNAYFAGIQKYLLDYAKANGIKLDDKDTDYSFLDGQQIVVGEFDQFPQPPELGVSDAIKHASGSNIVPELPGEPDDA